MKKKLALLLAGMMALSSLTACGSGASTGSAQENSAQEETQASSEETASESEGETAAEADAADYSGTLEVWSWTTDPEYQIEAFEKAYPGVKVNFTLIGTDYDTKMQTIVDNRTEGPDVFYADVKTVKNYIESDAWENLSADPYNADTSDLEDYTVTLASDDEGNLRAMTYQATPGGFWYKRDLAQKYLGTDDPDEISEMLSTMDGVLEVAETIKTQSGGATHMFASYKDIWQFANYGMRTTPWVQDGKFQMDEYVSEFFDVAKLIRDNGYDAKIDTWSEAWYASCADDSVFGYVEPTWGLQYVIMTGAPESEGNWGIASMPAAYFNGGSYLGIYQESQNKDLAWLYVNFVCNNDEFLTQYAQDKGDYTGKKSVNAAIAESGYEESWCAGQNTFEFFSSQMDKINTSLVTKYDDTIGNLLLNNVDLYLNGQLDKETAIQQFKDDVASNYRRLDVE
ncbi:MAG: extracellular solute-binding protein [Eubacteriales bacterium]|nr:extracellular solute-binding protein [Eubacteriales bacterium]